MRCSIATSAKCILMHVFHSTKRSLDLDGATLRLIRMKNVRADPSAKNIDRPGSRPVEFALPESVPNGNGLSGIPEFGGSQDAVDLAMERGVEPQRKGKR